MNRLILIKGCGQAVPDCDDKITLKRRMGDMKILELTDKAFQKYGRVIRDIDFSELLEEMGNTPVPEDVVYEPSVENLEELPIFWEIQDKLYGELPIQMGYCNGHNVKLNALEYHRSSEIDIAVNDLVVMLGCQQDITEDFTYDTSRVEAFRIPAGTAVELYATTLHYAPCHIEEQGFRCVIVLPKDTNLELEEDHAGGEDGHLTAKNKWLLGHPEGGLPKGSPMGLVGENLSL